MSAVRIILKRINRKSEEKNQVKKVKWVQHVEGKRVTFLKNEEKKVGKNQKIFFEKGKKRKMN